MSFLDCLKERVLVLDGAMGTMIQALDLRDADFGGGPYRMLGDLLTFSRPEDIEQIHLDYFRAGANAVETNTFGASPFRLSEYDFSTLDLAAFSAIPEDLDLVSASYEDIAYAMNRCSAELACQARDRHRQEADYDGRPLFVLGSLGPSNRVLSSTDADLKLSSYDEIAENFHCQALGLIDGGAEVLLFETQQDILEVKAAVSGGRRAIKERKAQLSIMVQVTVDQYSKMQIFNTDIHAALVTVEGIGIDVFGVNCSIGPDLMAKTVETLSRFSSLPISVVPNAGLPVSENGQTVYKLTPEDLAKHLERFVDESGVNIVGGCCGTGPEHIRAIADAVRGKVPKTRTCEGGTYLSGPQEAVRLDSTDSLIMIGERLNVRGSKKVREAVERDGAIDHAVLEGVVLEQIRDLGLSIIDVCMDSNLLDTTRTLQEVIHRQTTDFSGAMSIDSFGVDTLRETVKIYPGRPMVNSMSLEEVEPGLSKIQAVIEATQDHYPIYIALTAGPKGPAATRGDKCALAREIVEVAGRHGVTPDRIFIDMNVFPLGAESEPNTNFALESLEAIPLIKAIHPDLRTVCGVGNLTNGLAKKPYMRRVLTTVWLDEARKRGLDAAIVNPDHCVPVTGIKTHDYELALKAILDRDLTAFEELEAIAEEKRGGAVSKRVSYDDLSVEESICRKVVDGYKERESGTLELKGHTYAYEDRIVLQAVQALESHEPLDFINKHLMAAMGELGDGFGRGEVSLPHLLKSADVMKHVMVFLEEYMRVQAGVDIHAKIEYKGVIVLGTVYQDVHSIGKDLAKTLFENYGYRVIDLGVMTPLQEYLDKAKEFHADAIGMSALLVQTSNHMIKVSEMMVEQGLEQTPVLIGGAPVNDRHAAYVARAGYDRDEDMRGNVFYCQTAMDGVNIMNDLLGSGDSVSICDANRDKLIIRFERAQERKQKDRQLLTSLPRRVVDFGRYELPHGRYLHPRKVQISVVEFRSHIDKRNLYSLNWRFGGKSKQAKQGTSDAELEELFLDWTERADAEGWLRPQGVVAVYPCHSKGEEVVVYDIEDPERELCRFDFDVVLGSGKEDTISSAQYFRGGENGARDFLGLQISSTGRQVEVQLERFKAEGDLESLHYLQGLSNRLAEDMAGYLHDELRTRMGIGGTNQGTRWSPGYPAIPNMENNRRIANLLDAEARIGVSLTEAGEFFPTSCTAALVSFHPDARYM